MDRLIRKKIRKISTMQPVIHSFEHRYYFTRLATFFIPSLILISISIFNRERPSHGEREREKKKEIVRTVHFQ